MLKICPLENLLSISKHAYKSSCNIAQSSYGKLTFIVQVPETPLREQYVSNCFQQLTPEVDIRKPPLNVKYSSRNAIPKRRSISYQFHELFTLALSFFLKRCIWVKLSSGTSLKITSIFIVSLLTILGIKGLRSYIMTPALY